MADQATERTIVRASPEQCFETIIDFERYPQWVADVKAVAVERRDQEGRGTLVTFRAAAMGRSTRYTLAYDYSEAPKALTWMLVHGDIMRRLDGTYSFEASGDDTEVTYRLAVELVVPVPGFVKRRAEGRIIHSALRELRQRVEA